MLLSMEVDVVGGLLLLLLGDVGTREGEPSLGRLPSVA